MRYLLLALLTLTGCAGGDIYPYHMANITEACKDHGGWAVIYGDLWLSGRCVDGKFVPAATIENVK